MSLIRLKRTLAQPLTKPTEHFQLSQRYILFIFPERLALCLHNTHMQPLIHRDTHHTHTDVTHQRVRASGQTASKASQVGCESMLLLLCWIPRYRTGPHTAYIQHDSATAFVPITLSHKASIIIFHRHFPMASNEF